MFSRFIRFIVCVHFVFQIVFHCAGTSHLVYPVIRYLGYIHFLAVMNHTDVKIQLSFVCFHLLWSCTWELLDPLITLVFNHLRIYQTFALVAEILTFLPVIYEGFSVYTSLLTLIFFHWNIL